MLVPLLILSLLCANVVDALHSTDTITSGGDNTRSGYQPNHNMDPAVVGSSQFGIIWRKKLSGRYNDWNEQIFAQALIYTPDDAQFVYVASQQNWVYKIDAKTGDILVSKNLHIPFLVAELDNCNDISQTIGSTATGVIDPDTNTWYFTMKTYRDQTGVEKGRANGRYYVHALDTRTLEEKPNFPIDLEGLIASNNAIRMFQGGIHHQRPALMQSGPYIYAGFASHCVQYNFTGWIIGWHGTTGQIVEKFATEGGPEDKKGGGVWMSGGGIAQDSPNRMFFATGNGYASQLSNIPVPGRQPPTALEEAVVHMSIAADGSLGVVDFFMPWEKQALDGADKDLGTSGIALLDQNVFKTPTVARIGCITGKSGKLYFLNLDDLGGYQMGPNKKDAVLQTTELLNSVFATAGSYPLEGGYVYVNVVQHETVVFKFSVGSNNEPIFTQVAQTLEKTAYVLGVGHGTTTSLNGQAGTGLYWVTDIQGLNLRIYKAVPENGILVLLKGLNIPGMIKFSRPSFGDGRAYLTTSDGYLVAVGSPVNPPLLCQSPVEFGNATIGDAGVTKDLSCTANIAVTITAIGPRMAQYFSVSELPTFPLTLAAGKTFTFKTTFKPTAPGPLSDDIYVNTTNSIANYAENTPIAVRGVAKSLSPVLSITPNTVSFAGVITGENPDGYVRSVVIENVGSSVMTITSYDISIVSESGPFLPGNTTQAGPFKFTGLPTSIPAESSVTVSINFNPTGNGNYGAYVRVNSDGGNKFLTVVATSGGYPKAKLEFEKVDGTGWVEYDPNVPFSFGTVYEQVTRTLKLRLTNAGDQDAGILDVTVSKPPTGVGAVVGARNGIDLGEGTQLLAGQSQTAQLFCSVPKSQVNVNAYTPNATWTMNTNDPTFEKQNIVFTCDAVSEQLGPLKNATHGRYRYIGCFKENNPGRQLSSQLYGSDLNENGMCMNACAGATQNYIFAGTQYHRECWCGNTIPTLKVGDEDCNFDCTGNGTQICGGNGYFGGGSYISLFADENRYTPGEGPISSSTTTDLTGTPTPTPSAPIDNPGNGSFTFAGCYTEATTGRALSVLQGSDTMDVNTCLGLCAGYAYAGLEYGRECWCGNTLGVGSALTVVTQCRMTCAGNPYEYCGSGSRLSLYTKAAVVSSSSSTTVDSSTTIDPSSTPVTVSSTPTPTVPVHNPGNVNYGFQGCYTEATAGRALPQLTGADDMDIAKCLTICGAYEYAGVEYGRECWCGNTLGVGAVLTELSQCSMLCAGNKYEYCGAGSRLSLYKKKPAEVSSTLSTTTPMVSDTATVSATASGNATMSAPGSDTATTPLPSDSNTILAGNSTTTAVTATTPASDNTSPADVSSTLASSTVPVVESTSTTTPVSSSSDTPIVTAATTPGVSATSTPTSSVESNNTTTPATRSDASPIISLFISDVTTTSTTSTVSPSTTPSLWEYLGCANETTPRALNGASISGTMTHEKCQQFCLERNFPLAGLEYGNECYCGSALQNGSKLNQTNCAMACSGDASLICGGPSRLSVYNYTLFVPPIIVPAVGTFISQGCYSEATTGRALSGYSFTNTTGMTVELCVGVCKDRSFKYAGLEYSQECYCGNTLASTSTKIDDSQCNSLCKGNKREYCGAGSKLNVYFDQPSNITANGLPASSPSEKRR
ncbi:uncharacterized protein LAJ45_00199 [Morchella importuna]|uniref:uncharacterized protein n=1 Tax=Morchella importuna TaxID=1174673 RepID=UPI001E8EAC36|nr:uncharacterized protein LAJ45_00199 [Morchella importuna]KAH8155190.1 hypothetical protein LAJ45_00199 [Morchella importuna]